VKKNFAQKFQFDVIRESALYFIGVFHTLHMKIAGHENPIRTSLYQIYRDLGSGRVIVLTSKHD